MGTQAISLDGDGGTLSYEPFADSLTPFLKAGVKV